MEDWPGWEDLPNPIDIDRLVADPLVDSPSHSPAWIPADSPSQKTFNGDIPADSPIQNPGS